MSHAVLRGKPTAAQLYLDGLLDEVLVSRGEVPDAKGRGRLTLPQILYHSMAKNPSNVFMIHGATGEKFTNAQILKQAIPLARKLESEGARGKVVMVAMFNDQTKLAVYLALMFAGVVPFFLIPDNTVYEIAYFLKLINPSMVFCDEKHYKDMKKALKSLPELEPEVVMSNALPEMLVEFDVLNYQIPDACVDEMVLLVGTSGSTGLPKACILSHRPIVAKLAAAWYRCTSFPTPSPLALVTSPAVQLYRMVTSCIAFSVPLLLPYDCRSHEWVKTALLTYRPTWAQITLFMVKSFLAGITADHFSSLQCLKLGGADVCYPIITYFMDLLPKSAILEATYGMTESFSIVASSENGGPLRITNLYEYKLVDEDDNTLGLCATGELCIKGPALAKGYYRNNTNILEDGWYKTGDLFYIDEKERLYFKARKSTNYKNTNCSYLLCPEEIESVIMAIPGVTACVVCRTERGSAAAVVARDVTRDQVHGAINDALSLHKRLHGGVGFVAALPCLPSDKLDRTACAKIVQQLVATGQCY